MGGIIAVISIFLLKGIKYISSSTSGLLSSCENSITALGMSLSEYKTHERSIHFSHCFKHLTAKVGLDSFWPQAGTRSEGPPKLELSQFPEGPVTTCDLVPTPTSGLGSVQALEQVTRAGRVQCLPASLQ